MVSAVALPWLLKSMKIAQRNYDNPEAFVFAVNTIIITHIVVSLSVGVSFLIG
jgi:hypothetical protein